MDFNYTQKTYSKWLDTIGIGASFACAVHCIAMPVLFTTLPLFGIELLKNIWLEMATILVSVVIGSWALLRGYFKHHHNKTPVWLFATGIILLVIANLVNKHSMEMGIKFFAVSFIITAHIINWKSCKKCEICH
ncbi:MAG: MerC domain-containing protein [Ferruginibacter sp.]